MLWFEAVKFTSKSQCLSFGLVELVRGSLQNVFVSLVLLGGTKHTLPVAGGKLLVFIQ